FKDSHTKIITPQKTYDLDDDYDEDYFEFESFMGRKEYKMIKKRMQGGRVRSVEDGNYIATTAPLGYDIHWIKKSRTLKINEYESEAIKLIFKMYIEGNGSGAIADHLNTLKYKTKFGNDFTRSSVLCLIKNPIYIGKVTWKKKEIKKSKVPGKVKDTRTRDKSEWIVVDGKHEPIIDIDTWNKAQNILNNRYHIPYQIVNGAANPLAGVIVCGVCDSKMVMRKYKGNPDPRILCNKKCGNVSHSFSEIEKDILDGLEEYFKNYKKMQFENKNKNNDDTKMYEKQLSILQKELLTLNEQKLKLFDFLERGIYDDDTFLERSKNLDGRMGKTNETIKKIESIINKNKISVSEHDILELENLIAGYKKTNDIKKKNKLMKAAVNKIEFKKTKRGEDFEITLFPKVLP
ncbi:recombinase family protein, partial [Clostridium sp. UBA2485]|uniref:recombinase family protein n=1 Tax=Clostridium sp. UBA2485 TaxID=1946352 RepID=UPI0025C1AAB1